MSAGADVIGDILDRCADAPGEVALRTARTELTYGQLGARVRATAAGLRDAGLEPGERVLFSARPRPEGLVLALGIVAAGGSVVLVDPGTAAELFAARLGAAGPSWAATESVLYALSRPAFAPFARRRGLLLPDYARLPVRHVHVGRWLPGVPRGARRAARFVDAAQRGGFVLARAARSTARSGGGDGPDVARAPEAEALVVFTSGTTAAPRAVVHTRGSLGAGARLLLQVCPLGPGDVVHTDQLLLGLPALAAGAIWSQPDAPPGDAPARFARDAAGAACAFLVPADVTSVLDALEAAGVPGPAGPSARGPATLLVGAAPVSPALLRRGQRLWPGTRWVGVYGMTEVLPAATVEAGEKIAAADAGEHGDLVGRPLAGIRARIEPRAGDADGRPADGVGELVLSGPSLMRGYLAGAGPAHEHRTGDLARWDAQGRIVLVGRSRDMIIRRLTNIYPGLYEPALAGLPGVRDALLVGVPRPEDDDEVVVLVVIADDPPRPRAPSIDAVDRPGASAEPAASDVGAAPVEPVRLWADPVAARRIEAGLPAVVDHAALPDQVLFTDRVPLAGRSRKPDREALRQAAGRWLAARDGLASRSGAAGA
jgi:acyl-CoA synthetase (AMP-forming)/AMP-acid ligase II